MINHLGAGSNCGLATSSATVLVEANDIKSSTDDAAIAYTQKLHYSSCGSRDLVQNLNRQNANTTQKSFTNRSYYLFQSPAFITWNFDFTRIYLDLQNLPPFFCSFPKHSIDSLALSTSSGWHILFLSDHEFNSFSDYVFQSTDKFTKSDWGNAWPKCTCLSSSWQLLDLTLSFTYVTDIPQSFAITWTLNVRQSMPSLNPPFQTKITKLCTGQAITIQLMLYKKKSTIFQLFRKHVQCFQKISNFCTRAVQKKWSA